MITKRPSYLTRRKAHWNRNANAWDAMADEDQLARWDKIRQMHESLVQEDGLMPGLRCAYAGDWAHAERFFRRAIVVADRIIVENKCRQNAICEAGYPRNLAEVLRGRAYARWLLGEPLDRAELRRVAEHLAAWCLTKALDHQRMHNSRTMNYYLQAVRAAMIAGDLDYAAELLKTRHKFRWHHALERDLWTRLIAAYPEVGEGLREEVEVFFDRVRDPDFEELPDGKIPTFIENDILALETGLIRQMYLVNGSVLDPVESRVVVEAVAY